MSITAVQSTPVLNQTSEPVKKTALTPAAKDSAPAQLPKDKLSLQSKGSVSPIITISGGAFAGALVGSTSGGLLMGAGDLIMGGGQALKQSVALGSGFGAVAGFISGGVVANMTDSKLKATLYGAVAGAGIGTVAGGVRTSNLAAALISGGIGAISGATSAYMTSKWLGN